MTYEADEISPEDLKAAADLFDNLATGKCAYQRAEAYAHDRHNVVLSNHQLDRAMQKYACTLLSLEDCVDQVIEEKNRVRKNSA